MECFYINLDRATARRDLIEQQIKKSNLKFELQRFSAVNGVAQKGNHPALSNGQWGCWLSHVGIIEKSLSNLEDLLVIEDDEFFTQEINNILSITEHLKDKDWDIIYLDATIVEVEDYLLLSRACNKNLKLNYGVTVLDIPNTSTIYGTHAYLINGKKKEKVFDILKKNIQTGLAIDNVYAAAIQEGKIIAGVTIPFLCAPGEETHNSQINTGSHPLSKSWSNFREILSIDSPKRNNPDFLSSLHQVTTESVAARMNLSVFEVFSPYVDKINKLN